MRPPEDTSRTISVVRKSRADPHLASRLDRPNESRLALEPIGVLECPETDPLRRLILRVDWARNDRGSTLSSFAESGQLPSASGDSARCRVLAPKNAARASLTNEPLTSPRATTPKVGRGKCINFQSGRAVGRHHRTPLVDPGRILLACLALAHDHRDETPIDQVRTDRGAVRVIRFDTHEAAVATVASARHGILPAEPRIRAQCQGGIQRSLDAVLAELVAPRDTLLGAKGIEEEDLDAIEIDNGDVFFSTADVHLGRGRRLDAAETPRGPGRSDAMDVLKPVRRRLDRLDPALALMGHIRNAPPLSAGRLIATASSPVENRSSGQPA